MTFNDEERAAIIDIITDTLNNIRPAAEDAPSEPEEVAKEITPEMLDGYFGTMKNIKKI